MKKIGMFLLLWMIGVMLVGCSSYKITSEDWSTALCGVYHVKNETPTIQYPPFGVDKEEIITSYEQLVGLFNEYEENLEGFKSSQMEFRNEKFFEDYAVLTFKLYLSGKETAGIQDLYLDGNVLHISVGIDTFSMVSGEDEVLRCFIHIKKSVLEYFENIELDIINELDSARGTRFYKKL